MRPILVLNGPNLDLLGVREPAIYGRETLHDIEEQVREEAVELGLVVEFFQSNHEGILIDRLHDGRGRLRGALLNAGGLTHTSVSLRDAVAAVDYPVLSIHLSNTLAREEFRKTDLIAPVCRGTILGIGPLGYRIGLRALALLTSDRP